MPMLVLLLLAALAVPAHARTVNRVVATIDGKPLTIYDLKVFAARRRLGSGQPDPSPEQLLEELVTERLMGLEVEAQGLRAREEDVNRYVQDVLRRNGISEEQLRQVLEAQGIRWERYREQIAREIEKAQLINRELRAKVNVTPEDVEREYLRRREQWATPPRYRISQIFLRLPRNAPPAEVEDRMEYARSLVAKARSGANFAELARQHSEGPAAREGGELGAFALDEMLPEVARAVRSLEPGQVSEPVRSPAGIHIVRLDAQIEAGYEPLEEHAAEIREKLYQQRLEQRYERWLKQDLPARHHVARKAPPAPEELAPIDFDRIAAEDAPAGAARSGS